MAGVAGHMAHPYELPSIRTGLELVEFFNKAKPIVKEGKSSSLKIDGVNLSFRVVKEGANYEFAIDRGTKLEADQKGITISRVDERFGKEHPINPYAKNLLTILNEALPHVRTELKALGLLDEPNRILNTEYVSNTTNVIEHQGNFFAIHGINKILSRGTQKPSAEIKFDQRIFETLIKKLKPFAEKHSFSVFGQILTEATKEIDYTRALGAPCSVVISETTTITKPLLEWLKEAQNTTGDTIKLYGDKSVKGSSRKLYNYISSGKPVVDYVYQEHAEKAIYGFIMVEATRILGQEILNSLKTNLGEVKKFEGIVVRHAGLSPNPVKFTGNFIVSGQHSPFAKVLNEEHLVGEDKTITILPGAFKPPHKGHLHLAEEYAKISDKVVVLISAPLKNSRSIPGGMEITAEHSKKIWEMLCKDNEKIEIQISPKASPINAAYDFITNGSQSNTTNFIVGSSRKGNDFSKLQEAFKNVSNVNLRPLEETAMDSAKHSPEYSKLLEKCGFKDNMPSVRDGKDPTDYHSSDMRHLLSKSDLPIVQQMLADFLGGDFVNEVVSLFEMSSAGGGGMQGFPVPVPAKKKKPKEKKKKGLKEQNSSFPYSSLEEQLVYDIYKLITSKGLLK